MLAANQIMTMPEYRTRSKSKTGVLPWPEIVVGCLFACCIVALTHDPANLTTDAEESVEAGRGMEDIEKFHKNVNAAPLHRKLGFLGLLSLGGYCFFTAPRNTSFRNYAVILGIVACLTWLAASFLWSDDWRHTAREFVRIAAYACVAFSFALRFGPRQICLVIMIGLAGSVFAACSASVLSGIFRPWASDFRLHGTLHSNLLAHHALVVLLIAVALSVSSRNVWFWRSLVIAIFMVIILTKTRGALASAIVGVTAIKLIGKPLWSIALVSSLLGCCLLAFALLVSISGSQAQQKLADVVVLGRSKGVTTLTGRIPLWQAVWHESRGRRMQGYGYGAFWSIERTEKMFKELQWYPRHSHSAYVHTIMDLGYIGVSLVLALVFACLVASLKAFRASGDVAYTFFFGFLAAGLLDGFIEISYVSPRELGLYVSMVMMSLIIAHPTDGESETVEEQPTPKVALA